jgi:hypothetical protein
MGIDTKGFVVTKNKDVRDIAQRVLKAIKDVPCEKIHGGLCNPNQLVDDIEYSPKHNFFRVYFKDGELKRMLWVFLECDCDHLKYGENTISFSFGCHGNSVEIMKMVLDQFKDLGKCYIHENDCDGDPVEY